MHKLDSLRWRLLWNLALMLVVLMLASTLSAYYNGREAADTAYDRTLLASARTIAAGLSQRDGSLSADVPYVALDTFAYDSAGRIYYQVNDIQQRLISGYENLPAPPPGTPRTDDYPALARFYNGQFQGQNVRVVSLLKAVSEPNMNGMAEIRVAETDEARVSMARSLMADTLLRLGMLGLGALLVVWLAVSAALRPLERLRRAVEEREPDDLNPLAARVRSEREQLERDGLAPELAARQAGWRVFGAKPGAYGAGVQNAIDGRLWESRDDLAEVYLNWGGYAYGAFDEGTAARGQFAQRLGQMQAVVQNQDNREHDLLDSNDYYQFQGGMLAAVESLRGEAAASYHGDHSQPDLPKIRTLKEELNRVIRSRAANPKWIEGVKRHGYKGAFEMAATLDNLFAFDATTHLIDDHQYALLADAYLLDPDTREFVREHNPHALRDMTERLLEAQQRGLWSEPGEYREALENLLLDIEEE